MNLRRLKNNTERKKGFVLLYAIILTSIILAISLGSANIALKEIKFGTSAKETNEAFFAADAGAECALINDKDSSNSFKSSGGVGYVTCLGANIPLSGTYPSFSFILTGLGADSGACAKVTVYKDATTYAPNVRTTITSKGYNFGDASCNSSSPNRVEREVEVIY